MLNHNQHSQSAAALSALMAGLSSALAGARSRSAARNAGGGDTAPPDIGSLLLPTRRRTLHRVVHTAHCRLCNSANCLQYENCLYAAAAQNNSQSEQQQQNADFEANSAVATSQQHLVNEASFIACFSAYCLAVVVASLGNAQASAASLSALRHGRRRAAQEVLPPPQSTDSSETEERQDNDNGQIQQQKSTSDYYRDNEFSHFESEFEQLQKQAGQKSTQYNDFKLDKTCSQQQNGLLLQQPDGFNSQCCCCASSTSLPMGL